MNISEKRTETILEILRELRDMESVSAYGEAGYTDPEQAVLFADWNNVSRLVQDYLEEAGFALEWSDEWALSYEHDKAWRTSPDSYSWVCAVRYTEYGDLLTPECEASEWIEEMAVTDQSQPNISALPDHVDSEALEAEGYTLALDDMENGWYGREDDPSEITARLFESVPDLESVVFKITSVGQFAMQFEAWQKVA